MEVSVQLSLESLPLSILEHDPTKVVRHLVTCSSYITIVYLYTISNGERVESKGTRDTIPINSI